MSITVWHWRNPDVYLDKKAKWFLLKVFQSNTTLLKHPAGDSRAVSTLTCSACEARWASRWRNIRRRSGSRPGPSRDRAWNAPSAAAGRSEMLRDKHKDLHQSSISLFLLNLTHLSHSKSNPANNSSNNPASHSSSSFTLVRISITSIWHLLAK